MNIFIPCIIFIFNIFVNTCKATWPTFMREAYLVLKIKNIKFQNTNKKILNPTWIGLQLSDSQIFGQPLHQRLMHCKHPVFSVHNQPVHLLYLDIKLCLRCFKLPPNNSCQVRRLKFMDRAGGDLYICYSYVVDIL